ncbi:unnamed protein product [Paramecium sonneborni]|uniref:Uncharacterized protein n=1 Tax=Paramecium sonneborni TaxID=65129 RepID=A0A8S1KQP1_9CILI|nr:unnamed protein product [Paramecium sonneborni]
MYTQKEETAYFAANHQLFNLEFHQKVEDKQYFNIIQKTKNCHKKDINSFNVDENDKISISTSPNSYIKIWNVKGDLLKEINPSQGDNYISCLMKVLLLECGNKIIHLEYLKRRKYQKVRKQVYWMQVFQTNLELWLLYVINHSVEYIKQILRERLKRILDYQIRLNIKILVQLHQMKKIQLQLLMEIFISMIKISNKQIKLIMLLMVHIQRE